MYRLPQLKTFKTIKTTFAVITLLLVLPCQVSSAADAEGCLVCHRYRGLGRLDDTGEKIKLFYVDPTYHSRMLGSHARLNCTDCHDRSEVEIIPHKTTRPVDCTQSCHLDSSNNVEVRFAHDRIEQMLDGSVHTPEVLKKSNQLLDDPLNPSQSQCLLCHDEPTYRRSEFTWAQQEAPIDRCEVCHDQSLPVNTRRFYWHVHARTIPARSNQDMVRYCGVCHSNEKVRKEFDLTDSTASYLASFHGKGILLGDTTTAGCLDCHVGEMENVHQIKSHVQPEASTSTEKLADTCRSPHCHPRAGKKVGSASIHLQLSTSRGIEYLIAVGFVLLIIFTFGPSVMLTVLDMLQIIVGRHDPDDKENHRRAKRLLKNPKGRMLFKRFTPFQRVQHWALVFSFALLVVTGFPMKFADKELSAWFIDLLGGLAVARLLHRWAGAFLLIGFFFHLFIYVGHHMIQQRKETQKSYFRIFFSLPMVMSFNDFKQMGQLLLFLCFLRRTKPKWGRFSLEEKFEYFGVMWGTILLGITGILMWDDSLTTRFLPGRTLTVSNLIHSFEAFLALLHVGVVHLAGVLIAPSAFPCSPAMFTGDTPTEELAEAHPAMIDEVEQELARLDNNQNSAQEEDHA